MTLNAKAFPIGPRPSGPRPAGPRPAGPTQILKSRRLLLKWFKRSARELPWRNSKNPYTIWISEALLQQTQVKTALPFFKKFLKAFPDLQSLSQASQEEVLSLWRGLGYYKRAEHLLKAAKLLSRHSRWPESWKTLRALPGFGPYMARAVSSFAFDEPVGVLDGNVTRFLSRFHHLDFPCWSSQGRARFQAAADAWALEKPAAVNQALMEIGALICTPGKPLCALCPVQTNCQAFHKGLQNKLPLKKQRAQTKTYHYKPLVIICRRDMNFQAPLTEKTRSLSNKMSITRQTALRRAAKNLLDGGSKGNAWEKQERNVFALTLRRDIPFLKNRPLFAGAFQTLSAAPKRFHFCHTITRHKIYVTVQTIRLQNHPCQVGSLQRGALPARLAKEHDFSKMPKQKLWRGADFCMLSESEISGKNPSSLIQKILKQALSS